MTRLAFVAPIAILAAFVAGCASRGPANPAPVSITPIEQPFRAGTGVVQAVTPAPAAIAADPMTPSPGAAATSSTTSRNPAATAEGGLQRLRIRMDDGRTLFVDAPSGEFAPGTRVLLSDAREIRRQ